MSATDELRRLLDERGVEWTGSDARTGFLGWEAYEHYVFGQESGLVTITAAFTPAQAVEATLRRGTCRFIDEDNYDESDGCDAYSWFRCSACGWTFDECDRWLTTMSYCPNCGRKVVDV